MFACYDFLFLCLILCHKMYTEEADGGRWSIDEATNKFKSSLGGNYWKIALKSGVKLDGKVLERHICETNPDEYLDYVARYELEFVTPCSYQVMCKVRFKIHFVNYISLYLLILYPFCHNCAKVYCPDTKTLGGIVG